MSYSSNDRYDRDYDQFLAHCQARRARWARNHEEEKKTRKRDFFSGMAAGAILLIVIVLLWFCLSRVLKPKPTYNPTYDGTAAMVEYQVSLSGDPVEIGDDILVFYPKTPVVLTGWSFEDYVQVVTMNGTSGWVKAFALTVE